MRPAPMWSMPVTNVHAVLGSGERTLHSMPLKVFPLDKDEMKIGALGPPNGACDLVIRDTRHRISPLHCLIMRSGRHWYLMNESTNGTMLNDDEIEKGTMVRLRKGDRLSLAGEAVLVVRPK